MDFQFTNKSKVSTRKITNEGFLDVSASIYRSGLFEFSPREFSPDDLPEPLRGKDKIVLNVPDEAILDPEFLNSVVARPITDGHPSEFVNAKTARYISRGTTKGPATVENAGDVKLANSDLRIVDEDLIASVVSGEREEVSIGNTGSIDWKPGTRSGRTFDGVLDTIRVNHVAIVNRGRAGENVRLLNKSKETQKMEFITKIINGIEIQVSKENEKLVDSLVTKVENSETELGTIKAEFENAKTEIETLKKERDDATVSDERITELVNEKLETIETARKMSKDVDVSKSTREIKVSAIKVVNADLVSDDATDDVIDAVFATLAKTDRTESSDAAAKVQNAIDKTETELENEDSVSKAKKERRERRKNNFGKNNFGK